MAKRIGYTVLLLVVGGMFTVAFPARGEMKIELRGGKIINLQVNPQDILRISFEEGSSPTSAGGITWDFESGDLRGWTKTGDAFNFQPTYGDNPTARNRGQASNHQGQYWIGTYEKRPRPSDPPGQVQGDGPQGTLTSQPFTVQKPAISFLIGGGCDINAERVELLVDGQVVEKATGKCTETMERIRWNVSRFMGKAAQIRVIDASGGGWGHINFDDVKFE